MAVDTYKLDLKVFENLQPGQQQLKDWKGKASGIADYVATWGVEQQRSYFSWGVARVVLCDILGNELNISKDMPTANFQEQFAQLNFKQQVLLTDLLIEIAETIQFWTMRMDDANQSDV
ncbi:MAG: hypothetical protein BRC36_14340 [Cyanobacteria bacterium QH_2_48_84]|nr:MAG: hypothetical protein BRC36_14340 [Cyanobacteria bacterium QH_2_48_84]